MSTAEVLSPTSPNAIPGSMMREARNLQLRSITSPISSPPPVDQRGSFHMDKVIKTGWLQKRTRKTKTWKRRWFVLRGDRLSAYKDEKEYKIHRQVYLAELTAVAALKDAKKPNVFGLFSPSRNFHFQAESAESAKEWVEAIRTAAAIVDAEDDFTLGSPIGPNDSSNPMSSPISYSQDMRLGSSSPEFGQNPGAGKIRGMGKGGLSSQTLDYSGADVGSMSSFSDGARISQLSLSHPEPVPVPGSSTEARGSAEPPQPGVLRNESGLSEHILDSRVIWHGFLYCLRSKGGVRQWKRYWIVLRNMNLVFYKTEEEYRAIKVIPLESVVDAVEIDPLSKSKKHCMQVITEGKSYRLCAQDEETLAKCLGAMKSTLTRRALPGAAAAGAAASSPPSSLPLIASPPK